MNLHLLPDYFEISPFGVGSSPGVYALIFNELVGVLQKRVQVVLYIGSSKNMAKRVYSDKHLYKKLYSIFNGNISVASYETEDYLNVEKEIIKLLKPVFNSKHK